MHFESVDGFLRDKLLTLPVCHLEYVLFGWIFYQWHRKQNVMLLFV
jgi:hypothetical protein